MSDFLCLYLSAIVLENLVHDCQDLFAQRTRNGFLKWEYWKSVCIPRSVFHCSDGRWDIKKKKKKTYHVGLVPHILLAVSYSATQRGRLHILTPVGGATNTPFSAEQRGRQSCKTKSFKSKQTRGESKSHEWKKKCHVLKLLGSNQSEKRKSHGWLTT